MQAKNLFPNAYLIVGVCNDALTNERKGCTVMDENERYEGIRHCRYVDEVVRNAPWTLDDEYLNKHKIDFVAHDDIPYTTGSEGDVYAEIKAKGMFATTQRTAGVSTSDIVARIVKDYDVYVRRNLARGYTPKDLNVSFLKGKKFELMNKMDFMRDRGKKAFQGLGEKRNELIRGWEERSSSMISGFLRFFGQENLSNMWEQSKGVIMRALSPVPGEEEEEDEANNGHSSAPSSPRAKRRRSPNAVLEADPSLLEEYSSDDEH
ncbi:unnamed protein product [Cyprideis torosa]|uniref:choline-phosphate cytidylyltransferase n=1 Tax=Cyprideis torosa TaxID=163714 RepID=A0A7R8WD89_9CRUS|nr:unnamed protein product [Cyprideis torosa]CAG0894427.1 unnamed protein product [Cyprideis torosa]